MSDESRAKDPQAVWKEQPEEDTAMKLDDFVNRRSGEFGSRTRSEILMSITAALLLASVIAWRFAEMPGHLPQFGFAAVVVWVLVSLFWFRDRIWRKEPPSDSLAATGLDYYRRELERRRDHLRNEWIWHGPLILACLVLAVVLTERMYPGAERLRSIIPLLVLLALWTGYGIRRRLRQARELQKEIDEMKPL